ncbi:protein takeout [Anabrus simplex]|uniref:protein takeout n=1 Tax=Anabrus simplex TaxID=316456 RepID=UPI0035A3CC35
MDTRAAVIFTVLTFLSQPALWSAQKTRLPPYILQCYKEDPEVNQCLTRASNLFTRYLRRGIPELGYPEVEPILIDEIPIALGDGPDAYRAYISKIEAFGVSNLTVVGVRSDLDTHQFQLSFFVPKISVRAKYRSSGVLIMVRASGGGDYWGEYEGVRAKVYFRAEPQDFESRRYLLVDDVKMDFSVKDIRMGVENIHNGNTVLQAALNLFINTNAQDLLKEMKPDIKRKLLRVMRTFMDNIFSRIPYDMWMVE